MYCVLRLEMNHGGFCVTIDLSINYMILIYQFNLLDCPCDVNAYMSAEKAVYFILERSSAYAAIQVRTDITKERGRKGQR